MISLHKAYQIAKKYASFMVGDDLICGLKEDDVSWIFDFCRFVPGIPNGNSLSWSLARLNGIYGHIPVMYGGRAPIRVFKEDGRMEVLYLYIMDNWLLVESAEELAPKTVFEERGNSKYDFEIFKVISFNHYKRLLDDKDKSIDEIRFYFMDDEHEKNYYIKKCEEEYRVGCCDISGGCKFNNADDLANARIFDGKSLFERWNGVIIVSVNGMSLEEWSCRK